MTNSNFNLDQIRVASPCPASWEDMTGDHRVRFCGECKLNVYNLSAMGRDEAEELVRDREGRLCVRFFQRDDGSVLTRDCPVGLRALVRRGRARVAALASLAFAFLFGCGRPQVDQIPPLQGDVYVPQGQFELGELVSLPDAPEARLGRIHAPSPDRPGDN
jgi:hypothetical protein